MNDIKELYYTDLIYVKEGKLYAKSTEEGAKASKRAKNAVKAKTITESQYKVAGGSKFAISRSSEDGEVVIKGGKASAQKSLAEYKRLLENPDLSEKDKEFYEAMENMLNEYIAKLERQAEKRAERAEAKAQQERQEEELRKIRAQEKRDSIQDGLIESLDLIEETEKYSLTVRTASTDEERDAIAGKANEALTKVNALAELINNDEESIQDHEAKKAELDKAQKAYEEADAIAKLPKSSPREQQLAEQAKAELSSAKKAFENTNIELIKACQTRIAKATEETTKRANFDRKKQEMMGAVESEIAEKRKLFEGYVELFDKKYAEFNHQGELEEIATRLEDYNKSVTASQAKIRAYEGMKDEADGLTPEAKEDKRETADKLIAEERKAIEEALSKKEADATRQREIEVEKETPEYKHEAGVLEAERTLTYLKFSEELRKNIIEANGRIKETIEKIKTLGPGVDLDLTMEELHAYQTKRDGLAGLLEEVQEANREAAKVVKEANDIEAPVMKDFDARPVVENPEEVAENENAEKTAAQGAVVGVLSEIARKKAEEEAEKARKAVEEEAEKARKAAEEAEKAEQARKTAEEAEKAEQARKAAEEAEKARKAAEEAKKAEQKTPQELADEAARREEEAKEAARAAKLAKEKEDAIARGEEQATQEAQERMQKELEAKAKAKQEKGQEQEQGENGDGSNLPVVIENPEEYYSELSFYNKSILKIAAFEKDAGRRATWFETFRLMLPNKKMKETVIDKIKSGEMKPEEELEEYYDEQGYETDSDEEPVKKAKKEEKEEKEFVPKAKTPKASKASKGQGQKEEEKVQREGQGREDD